MNSDDYMRKKLFGNTIILSNVINKVDKFINGLNVYNLSLLFSLFVLFAHPAMTEHVEFALAANHDIHVSAFNYDFVMRMLDQSSQVSFVQFLLDLGINSSFTQILVSFLVTFIPVLSILLMFKLMDSRNDYSNTALLTFFCVIFYLVNPINVALYPWSPSIGFFEFGNQGMWLCIGSLILLVLNKKLGFLLSGVLFSWHMVWFIPILLYLGINFKQIQKKNYIYFFIGLIFSFIFLQYGKNSLESFTSLPVSDYPQINFSHLNFKFKKISDSFWSRHNPLIFGNSINFLYLIGIVIPIISLNYLKLPKQLLNFCNLLFVITLFLIFYIEIARQYPLPFSDVLFRAIVNRFFNLIIVIYIYYIFFYFLNLNINKKKIKEYLHHAFLLISTLFFFKFTKILRFALFIFLYKHFSRKIKYFDIFLILLFLFAIGLKDRKSLEYNIFTFFHPNKIEKFLSSDGRGQGFILSQGIQSFRGLNITTLSKSEYFRPTPPLFINNKYIDLFCYESLTFDNIKMEYSWDVDECFKNRSREDWDYIFNLIGVHHVIVSHKIKLDLDLILDSDGLRIYSIRK